MTGPTWLRSSSHGDSSLPEGWEPVPVDMVDRHVDDAREVTQWAARSKGLADVARLAEDQPAHPALLVRLWPELPTPSPADLYLLTQLGYPVDLQSAHRLLHGPESRFIGRASDQLDPAGTLYLADAATLAAMETLLLAFDAALSGSGLDPASRRAAAHFLCARQRPHLFPLTGPDPRADHRPTWQLIRSTSGDPTVRQALAAVADAEVLPTGLPELSLLVLCLTAHSRHLHRARTPTSATPHG